MLKDREVIAEIMSKTLMGRKKKTKTKTKTEEQFSESVHCYSPIPSVERRRSNKKLNKFVYVQIV